METVSNRMIGSPCFDLAAFSNARSILKNDLGYSDWAAGELLAIYRENLQFVPRDTSGKTLHSAAADSGSASDAESNSDTKTDPQKPEPKVGDHVQWTSGGVDQFAVPRRVSWVSSEDGYLRVEGNMAGISIAETTVVDPPRRTREEGDTPKLSVLMTDGRLQITADVDREGLQRLKEILAKYEEILKLTGA